VVHESSQAARQIVASVTQQNAGIAQMTDVITTLSRMMGDVVEPTMSAEPQGGARPPTLAPRTALLTPAFSSSASLHQPAAEQQGPHSA
jgi:hypothetical protein